MTGVNIVLRICQRKSYVPFLKAWTDGFYNSVTTVTAGDVKKMRRAYNTLSSLPLVLLL